MVKWTGQVVSKVVHPKPVWGWSVVLFSTLLLSPTAATALWHAFAQTAVAVSSVEVPISRQTVADAQTPRRTDDETAALRAARAERPRTLRLDTQPDTFVVFFAERGVVLVPDEDDGAARTGVSSDAPRSRALERAPTRAPPVLPS